MKKEEKCPVCGSTLELVNGKLRCVWPIKDEMIALLIRRGHKGGRPMGHGSKRLYEEVEK